MDRARGSLLIVKLPMVVWAEEFQIFRSSVHSQTHGKRVAGWPQGHCGEGNVHPLPEDGWDEEVSGEEGEMKKSFCSTFLLAIPTAFWVQAWVGEGEDRKLLVDAGSYVSEPQARARALEVVREGVCQEVEEDGGIILRCFPAHKVIFSFVTKVQ